MLSVLLVDGHDALREGMGAMLRERAVAVLGSVGSAEEARTFLEDHDPDVAVVGLRLPGRSGLALIREIRASHSRTKTLIYTASDDKQTLADSLHSGAEGIALKHGGMRSFMDALRAVARGDRYVDPAINAILEAATASPGVLTSREREVFELLAGGRSGEEIAGDLHLSPETVRTHIRNAMGKLQAKTRTEAVVTALENGELNARHPAADRPVTLPPPELTFFASIAPIVR